MRKALVIKYFGNIELTANALGISGAAVGKWPEMLSPGISARVMIAAIKRDGITAAEKVFPSVLGKSR